MANVAKGQEMNNFSKSLVSYAAVLSVVTQRSSPQTPASIRTACLSFCVCGKSKQLIMSRQNDNDVVFCAKKIRRAVSGDIFAYVSDGCSSAQQN